MGYIELTKDDGHKVSVKLPLLTYEGVTPNYNINRNSSLPIGRSKVSVEVTSYTGCRCISYIVVETYEQIKDILYKLNRLT